MVQDIAICWFRQDLRLSDNPAFVQAARHKYIMPIYILDEHNAGEYRMGGVSKWWLHHSLKSLNESLNKKLSTYIGNPLEIILDLLKRFPISAIYWNHCYEPWHINNYSNIKKLLSKKENLLIKTFNGSLLWEPWEIKKNDGTPYKVFTPFYQKCLKAPAPRTPLEKPINIQLYHDEMKSLGVDKLKLLPKGNLHHKFKKHWNVGEEAAVEQFRKFLQKGLDNYKEGRNFLAEPYVSKLSPHLHFGEISPNQLWHELRSTISYDNNIEHFCSELAWREFSYNQLYYNPDLPSRNVQQKFDNFPWSKNEDNLKAWQEGKTGIPIIDAGMRELWQTGYMHNRTRMIVGSFLTKNLLIHWCHGHSWFWSTLVDADLANNSSSWQWVAGCGLDAAPYFRIFNPVTQGQKFDPEGDYVRKFIPELSLLPNKYLFNPWEAPKYLLRNAEVELGVTYPKPIIDLKISRNQALEIFKTLSIYANPSNRGI